MKLKFSLFCLLMCLVLGGCSANKVTAPVNTAPPAQELYIIPQQEQEKTQISFNLNGTVETVPAYIYEGMDYTIAVPEGGWHMYEPGAWQATFNQSIKFYIKGYSGDNAKKLVEQLSSQGYVLGLGGNVMTKSGGDDLIENVMIFRNGDSMRAVFYCYTPETASSFGVRLDTIVNTFSWKDPQDNATSGNMAGLSDAELQDALKVSASIIKTEEGQSPQAAQIALIISSAEEKSKKLEAMLERDETQSDMNLTSAELYSVWDDAINSVWKILRDSMDETDFDYLLDEQLQWIEYKEIDVSAAAAEYQGGSMAALAANMKATELTRARVYELAKMID